MTNTKYSFISGLENKINERGTVCRLGGSIPEENMIARCQKRRRTRIANSGQVFNEQAIWRKLRNCLLVLFCASLRAKRSNPVRRVGKAAGARTRPVACPPK